MGQVFVSPYKDSLVWSAQGAAILISKAGGSDQALILGALDMVDASIQRAVTTRYPIGNDLNCKPIKLVGAPQGTLTLRSLIGPTTSIATFLDLFGSVCDSFTITVKSNTSNNVNPKAVCTGTKESTIKCLGCTGQAARYSLQTDQQGMSIAQGQFQITFTNMLWD